MTDAMTHDEKMMLALAALTYRGIIGNERGSQAPLRRALVPWLEALEGLGFGTWKLVWGPASFRVPLSLVDDAMVYVAKRADLPQGSPAHYAIAIRGTNPVSLFDWVFGDLWVDYQVAWSETAPQALLSGSTSLGDAIIRELAAGDGREDDGQFGDMAQRGRAAFGALTRWLARLDASPLASLLEMPDKDLLARVHSVMGRSTCGVRALALAGLGDFFDGVRDLMETMRDGSGRAVHQWLKSKIVPPPPGVFRRNLLTFLNGLPDTEGARVSVTGHSKGGALAFTTALWLEEEWAPGSAAEIDCFSFAGPTPGNGGFAAYYGAALAERTHRVVNGRDVVPHAWHAADLRRIAEVYPALDGPMSSLAQFVDGLDYQHVQGSLCKFDGLSSSSPLLFGEIIHQHLDAYLIKAEFDPPWRAVPIMTGSDPPMP